MNKHNQTNNQAMLASDENNQSLRKIIQLINQGENIFVTGYAGAGKSYILNKVKTQFDLEVTSTTGLAAVNIGGQTLHSWAGVGICNKSINQTVEYIFKRPKLKKQILNCKILAIDEISMLDATTFDYIDAVIKMVRHSEQPFGGIQVLLFGDFFQLPPVEKASKGFCFASNCWQSLDLKTIFLEKIYRQHDLDFIQSLNNVRANRLTVDDIARFYSREVNYDTSALDILHIFSTNEEADNYNRFKFQALQNPVHTFLAQDKFHKKNAVVEINSAAAKQALTEYDLIAYDAFDKYCKAPQKLALKKGCKVMLLINLSFSKGLINGSCGTVNRIENDFIIVKFDNGVEELMSKHTFEYHKGGELIVTRDQYPLRLAYGITIHKSQGMTLDKLVVNCNRIFECGQAYVAFSRVKTLDGLYLKAFHPRKIMVDNEIINFYASLAL